MKNVTITVTGMAASGKSALAYHIYETLENMGFKDVKLYDRDLDLMPTPELKEWAGKQEMRMSGLKDKCSVEIKTEMMRRNSE